jgi:hypothetical protein
VSVDRIVVSSSLEQLSSSALRRKGKSPCRVVPLPQAQRQSLRSQELDREYTMTVPGWATATLIALALLTSKRAAAREDPGATGPNAVSLAEYTGVNVDLTEVPQSEVLAQVHYPTGLAKGPYPLVVFLHGRHLSCYDLVTGSGTASATCNPRLEGSVPSYRGYDYLGSLLASHGIIAVSISANAINSFDGQASDFGMKARGELIQHHLDMWAAFATHGGAPFGTRFVGKVDLQRVGTVGHSRGGEGAIWNFEQNATAGAPYGIRAVLTMAPTNFLGHSITQVPLAVLLGSCDGDAESLPGARYVDDARYVIANENAPKYAVLALGANHNYFNRMWTPDQFSPGTCTEHPASCVSRDDWQSHRGGTDSFCEAGQAGNGRLNSRQQRGFARAYVAAFFRRYLLGATQFDPLLTGHARPPVSAQTSAISQGYVPAVSERTKARRLTSRPGPAVGVRRPAIAPPRKAHTSTAPAKHFSARADAEDPPSEAPFRPRTRYSQSAPGLPRTGSPRTASSRWRPDPGADH